jgi:glycosyltransferase involved in cell wall biosynthesis
VKLIIQIPCLNERDHLKATFDDLPRAIAGIDTIEVLVIDDGSTDGTSEVARELGVHHIVRFPKNRGLAAAYMAGLDASVRLGADVIVNTDADNQYRGEDIAKLVEPIVEGRAEMVVGDRKTDTIAHFSPLKKMLQKFGSSVVRRFSGTPVSDTTSGFRALSAAAARKLFVHNRFTYTLETLIQAGHTGMVIENAVIRTNEKTRESRLFKSIPSYMRRNGIVIVRSYAMYRPMRTLSMVALFLFLVGAVLGGRFLYNYVLDPGHSRHLQSLMVAVGAIVLSILIATLALLADLLAANRRMIEDVLQRVRRMEGEQDKPTVDGVVSTTAEPWRPGAVEAKASADDDPADDDEPPSSA